MISTSELHTYTQQLDFLADRVSPILDKYHTPLLQWLAITVIGGGL